MIVPLLVAIQWAARPPASAGPLADTRA